MRAEIKNLDTTFRTGECKNKRVIEWIDIKTIFPPPATEVLFFTNRREIISGNYEITDKQFFTSHYGIVPQQDVTHWADISHLAP
jgi:hypothetical protein